MPTGMSAASARLASNGCGRSTRSPTRTGCRSCRTSSTRGSTRPTTSRPSTRRPPKRTRVADRQTMSVEVETARAKVNLWLNVVGRRDDGYHLLHSLVAFADLGDTLEIAPAEDFSLVIDGLGAAALSADPDNLVLKAARLLAAETGVRAGAAFRLTKRIPMAAGLGGGSADAAAALRGLVRLWRLDLPSARLSDLAARLGADVPMCLHQLPCIASGVGEKLDPAPPLPGCGLLLVNAGVPLSTPEVF